MRHPLINEVPALRHIWGTVFGSSDFELFLGHYFALERCVVSEHGCTLASAGYYLPAGNIVFGGQIVPCAMIYAVATLPEYRNKGHGTAVVRSLIRRARDAGYPAVVLCPSSDELFGYYSAHTGLHDWFFVCEHRFNEAPKDAWEYPLEEITAVEYARLRKTLLAGFPHVDSALSSFEYQGLLCKEFGGGFFRIDIPGGISCAVVEQHADGTVWARELLMPAGGEADVFSSIVAAFPADEYVVRTPVINRNESNHMLCFCKRESIIGTGERDFQQCAPWTDDYEYPSYMDDWGVDTVVKRFGMLAAPDSLLRAGSAKNAAPWYGLAFD